MGTGPLPDHGIEGIERGDHTTTLHANERWFTKPSPPRSPCSDSRIFNGYYVLTRAICPNSGTNMHPQMHLAS